MLQIKSNYITNEKELVNYENTSHKEAFEYMPLSKGKTYMDIVDVDEDPVTFLAIKITTEDCDPGAIEMFKEPNIDTINLKAISVINRVFLNFKKEFEVNSISYQYLKLRSEGVLINALITTSDGEPLPEHTQSLITALLKNKMKMSLTETEIELLEETGEIKKSTNGELPDNSTNEELHKEQEVEKINESNKKSSFTFVSTHKEKDNIISENTAENVKSKENESDNYDLSPSDKNDMANFNCNPFGSTSNPLFTMFMRAHSDYNHERENESLPQKSEEAVLNDRASDIDKEAERIEDNEMPENHMSDKAQNDINVSDADLESSIDSDITTEIKESDDLDSIEPENINLKENDNKSDNLFTERIYKEIGDYSEDDLDKQKSIYDAGGDIPFLNAIDKYIPNYDIRKLEEDKPVYELHEEDYGIKTTASEKMIRKAFERTMNYFMESESLSIRRTLLGEKDEASFMEDLKIYVNRFFKIPEEDKEMFFKKCYRALFSYYVLTPAINNPDISDIRVLAPDNINVKIHGTHYTVKGLSFLNVADYNRFIESLIIRNKVSVNNPILVFTDKDFNPDYILRFNLCLPAINSTEMPYLHIRKVPKKKTTVNDLIKAGMMDDKIAAYLLDKVVNAKGIVFAGPSASGKTTAMNAFIDYIPKSKSIICTQESEELFSDIHPNAYFQHMLKDPKTGKTIIGLSELGQNGLLCDSGYFIIGECKGAEVRDLLRASNTGHKCWCSVHSQNTRETIPRLADYVKYGSDYSLTEATRMLKDLEVIVYIDNFKIKEISEIVGYDEDKKEIIYKLVYKSID